MCEQTSEPSICQLHFSSFDQRILVVQRMYIQLTFTTDSVNCRLSISLHIINSLLQHPSSCNISYTLHWLNRRHRLQMITRKILNILKVSKIWFSVQWSRLEWNRTSSNNWLECRSVHMSTTNTKIPFFIFDHSLANKQQKYLVSTIAT